MLAALALGSALQATTPVLYGYDVVEYFSLDADADGVCHHRLYCCCHSLKLCNHLGFVVTVVTGNGLV